MKKLFLGLSIFYGVYMAWGLYQYFITPATEDVGMIMLFMVVPMLVLFALSLFLYFRERKVSLKDTNSLDRISRITISIIVVLLSIFIFFPNAVSILVAYIN